MTFESELATPLYPAVDADTSLRVGVLLEESPSKAWMVRVLEEIQSSKFAVVDFVAVIQAPNPSGTATKIRTLIYDGYVRHEAKRNAMAESSLQAADDSWAFPSSATRLNFEVPVRDGAPVLTAAQLDEIRLRYPDVIVQLGFPRPLGGALLSIPPHGVWVCTHGGVQDSAGAGLFADTLRNAAVSMSELKRLEPDGAATVLDRSAGSAHPHSLELGKQAAFGKAPSLIVRSLRRLSRDKVSKTLERVVAPVAARTPGNLQMMKFLATISVRRARGLVRSRLGVKHWSIGWRRGGRIDPECPQITGMRSLPSPRGHFYADPFLFRLRGEDWLFLEDYDYAAQKADIIAMPFGEAGPSSPPRTALRLDEHLSYPFVFEWKDDVYMLPEIGDLGGPARLFRARRFPDDWEPVCELISGHLAVDATLHEHRGRWYLFANIREHASGSENDELFLFHSETPLGPFAPHPLNPIVSDVRRARPAGRLFEHRGRLIRPSQDCAGEYGRALVFNEVLQLSPQEYRERPLGCIAAGPHDRFLGCHTYAALGDLEIVDFKHLRMRWAVGA